MSSFHPGLSVSSHGMLEDTDLFEMQDSEPTPGTHFELDGLHDITPLPTAAFGGDDRLSPVLHDVGPLSPSSLETVKPVVFSPPPSAFPLTPPASAAAIPPSPPAPLSSSGASPAPVSVDPEPSASSGSGSESHSLRFRRGVSRLPPYMYLASTPRRALPVPPMYSSSSIKPPPSMRQSSNEASTSASASGSSSSRASSAPAPLTFDDVRDELNRNELADDVPTRLFKYFRSRKVNGEPAPPLFTPDPPQLLEILKALDRYASKTYLRKAADDERYTDVFVRWILQAREEPEKWYIVLPALFRVLSKTDIPINYVQEKKIGSTVARLGEQLAKLNLPNQNKIQQGIADFRRWVTDTLVANARTVKPGESSAKDKRPAGDAKLEPEAKRRRSDDAIGSASSIAARPASSSKPISSVKPVSSVKPNASTFGKGIHASSTPRQLPKIEKKPPQPPALGNANSLLASTMAQLKQLEQGKKASLLSSATASFPRLAVKHTKAPNKKGFNIRFMDTEGLGELEAVKLFKEEPHEFERPFWIHEENAGGVSHMKEGSFMGAHNDLEEEIDWFEPLPYEGVAEIIPPTPEVEAQDRRELGVLGDQYTGKIPPCPDETGVKVVSRGPSTGTWFSVSASAPPPPPRSVSALLGSLDLSMFGRPPASVPSTPYDAYSNAYPPQPTQYHQPSAYTPPSQNYYPPPVQQGYGNWGNDSGWNSRPQGDPAGGYGYGNGYGSRPY